MELGDVDRQPAQLLGEIAEDGRAERLVPGDQWPEVRRGQDVGHRWLDRDGRRRAWRAVEEHELAEDLARAKGHEDRLLAFGRFDRDLRPARGDDVHRIAQVTLVEDGLAGPITPLP